MVLAKITPREDKDYIGKFKEIVSNTYPRLTMEKIVLIHSEKPILGQVLRDCLGYEEVLV